MDTFFQDLRFTLRQLVRNPGFTATAVGTLALGIGATAAIFSVVNGVLLRPLPYPDADRIVRVFQEDAEGRRMNSFSEPNFLDLRERSRSFDAIAQFSGTVVSVAGGDEAARVVAATVSEAFFGVFGVEPFLGRDFLPEERSLGGPSAVVVSHGYWERYLGGEPNATDQVVRIGDQVYPVVGVMPSGFAFPTGADLWIPREALPAETSRTAHNWQVVGRLAPDRSAAQAGQEVDGIARGLKEEHGEDTWMSGATVVSLRAQSVETVRPALFLLAGAAALLLLLVCANVVNLLLARASVRRQELSVRLALGARRRRLIGQFVTESMALCLLGGAGGVLLALWSLDVLLALGGTLPRGEEVQVDAVVILFTLGVSMATAVGLGLLTAWRAAGTEVGGGLASGGTRAGASPGMLPRVLASTQVALALVLLIGVGLLGRSFFELVSVDPGFRTGGAVVMDLSLPHPGEAEAFHLAHFHQEVLERLESLPGVVAAGGASAFPLGGNYANGAFLVLEHPDEVASFEDFGRLAREPDRMGYAHFRVASPGYFRAMGIPLLHGRLLDERDTPNDPHVAVISESLAVTQWPGEDPLGKLVQFGNMDGDLRAFTIVGVVGDIREASLEAEPRPTFYGHFAQRPGNLTDFTVVAAGPGETAATIAAARGIVAALDPDVPPNFRTLEEVFGAALSERRFNLLLLGAFGSTALLLALMGIYGVVSLSVSRRTRELGVRMALGARQGSVVGLVLREGLVLAGTGVVLGLIGAMLLSRLVRGFLYGVGAWDPLTFAAVALVLSTVALAATLVPARRAARVDPMIAMRAE